MPEVIPASRWETRLLPLAVVFVRSRGSRGWVHARPFLSGIDYRQTRHVVRLMPVTQPRAPARIEQAYWCLEGCLHHGAKQLAHMSSMTSTRRPIWLAFVFTPLLMPLALWLVFATYLMTVGHDQSGVSWSGHLAYMYRLGVPAGYVTLGALGGPWIATLIHTKKLNVGHVCVGACIIGWVSSFLLAGMIDGTQFMSSGVIQKAGSGLVVGLLSGLIFCAIAGVPVKLRK